MKRLLNCIVISLVFASFANAQDFDYTIDEHTIYLQQLPVVTIKNVVRNAYAADLPFLDGAVFKWRSEGNHPSHKVLIMQKHDTDYVLILHRDATYGTNRADYFINLSKGTLRVDFVEHASTAWNIGFELENARSREQFYKILKDFQDDIFAIAGGDSIHDATPQLIDIAKYFDFFL